MSDIAFEFEKFPSLHRYSKEMVIVTEKIDGTNAQVFVSDDGSIVRAGSRNRWITPSDDNFGFARFVEDNRLWLQKYLGPGRHYGEWWGSGIQRGYALDEGQKRFSLFNAGRWGEAFDSMRAGGILIPEQIGVVPVLGIFQHDTFNPIEVMQNLKEKGSSAKPNFMDPEGIVAYHTLSKATYKMTFDGDKHKWETTIDQSRGQPEGH